MKIEIGFNFDSLHASLLFIAMSALSTLVMLVMRYEGVIVPRNL